MGGTGEDGEVRSYEIREVLGYKQLQLDKVRAGVAYRNVLWVDSVSCIYAVDSTMNIISMDSFLLGTFWSVDVDNELRRSWYSLDRLSADDSAIVLGTRA